MQKATAQGAGTAKGTPMTLREMDALQRQRGELKDQLNALTGRRNTLQEQMLVMPTAQRGDHALRIKEIDQRASDIDRALMRLDVQIADGLAQPLINDGDAGAEALRAAQEAIASIPPPPAVPGLSRDAERAMILGGLAFSAVAIYAIYLAARRFFMKPSATSIEGQSRRLDQLQQSVDVIALEVERMSESQRFVAKVLNDKFPALGVGAAQAVDVKAKDAVKL